MEISEYKTLYTNEAADILQALENGIMKHEDGAGELPVDDLFRHAHNLKGMSGTMGYDSVVEASHSVENVLGMCREGKICISSEEADVLFKVIDFLRDMVNDVVENGESDKSRILLEEIKSVIKANFEDSADRETGGKDLQAEDDSKSTADCKRGAEDTEKAYGNDQDMKEKDKNKNIKSSNRDSYYTKISSTRVELERLDNLMDLVGELIISRFRLSSLAEEIESKALAEELLMAGRLISGIQKEIVEARLVPAGNVFQRFKRLVRDVSKELNKKARLKIVGADIGLDRTILEMMIDPLVHIIRNALDHGIESPAERQAAGKDEVGKISLRCSRERNFVIIEIEDDGKGIDLGEVVRKRGNTDIEDDSLADSSGEELCRILTSPGFSTRKEVGKYSGRGVGMNAAKKAVESLGGAVSVDSSPGEGTKIQMRVPITLSIIKALLFKVAGEIHALPVEYIKETTRVEKNSFKTVGGSKVFLTKDGAIPLIQPGEIFKGDKSDFGARFVKVIVLETERGIGGLVVSRILGQQEVVIKGLPSLIRGMEGVSGATVLGSGKVAFIWDPRYLLRERQNYEFDRETVVSQT
ncbi:MAG: chemotaxis protein CheA [Candidatus Krumholzibacteriota bacterium]|nr:chemotaxis protein CheA [Candidatus Krumholzibacteriota bacterium]